MGRGLESRVEALEEGRVEESERVTCSLSPSVASTYEEVAEAVREAVRRGRVVLVPRWVRDRMRSEEEGDG